MGFISTWILFMQVFLITVGALSLAMEISFTVPMAVNEVLVIWSIIRSWMKPPYLYVLINCIIITIAASSRFRQSGRSEEPAVQSQHVVTVKSPPPSYFDAFSAQPEVRTVVPAAYEDRNRVVELKPVIVNGSEVDMEAEEETVVHCEADDAFVHRNLSYNNPSPERFSPESQLEYLSPVKPTRNIPERLRAAPGDGTDESLESLWRKIMKETSPIADATNEEVRLAEAARSSPDRALDYVPKPKSFKERSVNDDWPPSRTRSWIQKEISPSQSELKNRGEELIGLPAGVRATRDGTHDSLESAWRKIMKGASSAADATHEEVILTGAARPSPDRVWYNMAKSKRFKERSVNDDWPPSRTCFEIQKEISPSEDELNQRVEAFIEKVNYEIKMWRQESLDQY